MSRVAYSIMAASTIIWTANSTFGQCVEPPQDLIAWWTGDVDASDHVGNIDGSFVGDASAGVPGYVDGAFTFDGVGDYVDLGQPAALDLRGDMTLAMWVKLDTIPDPVSSVLFADFEESGVVMQKMISVNLDPGGQRVFFQHSHVGSANLVFSGDPIDLLGAWHYVAAVRDDTAKRVDVYIDAVLYATGTYPGETVVPPQGINTIGRAGSFVGHYVDGLIDEVEIYNRALSFEEIESIYLAGSDGKCKDLSIPTVSEWGLIGMAILVLTAGALVFAKRQRQIAA